MPWGADWFKARNLSAPNCAACPFAKLGQPPHQPVLAVVPTKKLTAVLVGEGASRDDSESGKPLSGITGQQLDSELRAVNLEPNEMVKILAVACFPAITVKSEPAMQRAAKCCSPLFWSQLRPLKLEGIHALAMGRWAHFALLGKSKRALSSRGFIREWSWPWLK